MLVVCSWMSACGRVGYALPTPGPVWVWVGEDRCPHPCICCGNGAREREKRFPSTATRHNVKARLSPQLISINNQNQILNLKVLIVSLLHCVGFGSCACFYFNEGK